MIKHLTVPKPIPLFCEWMKTRIMEITTSRKTNDAAETLI
jgi:hypothetical protein